MNTNQSVIAEVAALTERCGLFTCGDQLLSLKGGDAVTFLQGMVTQNVQGLKDGEAAASWLLDNKGKIIAPLHIARSARDQLWLSTAEALGETVRKTLDRYIIMEDARITLTELTCLTLQGPEAMNTAGELGEHRFPHPRLGDHGVDIWASSDQRDAIQAQLIAAGVTPVGQTAIDQVRVAHFKPWFGIDIPTGVNPVIYGLGGISHTKGCYIGQETVAMTRDRGRPPQRGVRLTAAADARLEASPLYKDGKEVGQITTTVATAQGPQALATLKYAAATIDAELKDRHDATWRIDQLSEHKVHS